MHIFLKIIYNLATLLLSYHRIIIVNDRIGGDVVSPQTLPYIQECGSTFYLLLHDFATLCTIIAEYYYVS